MLLASFLAPAGAVSAIDLPSHSGGMDAADLPMPMQAQQLRGQNLYLYLEVSLNQRQRGLRLFLERDGHLQAQVATLRDIGFIVSDHPAEQWLALESFEGLHIDYDATQQQLTLQAPWSLLSLAPIQLGESSQTAPEATASPGVLVNYDLYANHASGADSVVLGSEVRLFGIGNGTLTHTGINQAVRDTTRSGWRHEYVRLDTTWQFDFPKSAVSLSVGDVYSGSLDWSRSMRMGGIQIRRNFALQPYRIITPTPSFLGEAALPSNVELYVEGLRQYSGEVPAGPFQLASQPAISGAGNAQLVLTDAYGRVQTLDFPLYGTGRLLAAGESDWSIDAGWLREAFGIRSFAYDSRPVASASLRRGISDTTTVEAHAEGGGGLAMAGAGAAWLLGESGGVLNAAYAHSNLHAMEGGQFALGYQWNSRRFSASIGTQRSHGDFRDLSALQGLLPAQASDFATLGVNSEFAGSFSASYVNLKYPDGMRSRYASLFWSRTLAGNWAGSLSMSQNLERSQDRSVYLAFSAALGDERQANLALQRNGDQQALVADLSRPLPGDGDVGGYGWRLQARTGDGNGGLAELGWLGNVGRYSVGIADQAGQGYAYANASGSLVWMGGHVFAARDINDAFALVDTGGWPGIPVRLENRPIGVTNADGVLLVTPLRSWQRNRLTIDTWDLPANVRVARVEAEATPRQKAGVRVDFEIKSVRAALLVLHDAAGQPLPPGSEVRLRGSADTVLVGYDGETYLDTLQAHNILDVRTQDAACIVRFDYPPDAGELPRLGPLPCLQETP
jgi:outer membrane usher protein